MHSRSLLLALIVAATVAACGGDDGDTASTSTEPVDELVLAPEEAPAGTVYATTVTWDEIVSSLDGVAPSVARLEDLGVEDGAFSIFLGGVPDDGRPADLAGDGLLRVSGALAFGDTDAATSALADIMAIASGYASDLGASVYDVDAGGEGAVALGTSDLAGEAVAVGWADGNTVHLSFAQGGDADGAAAEIAAMMGGAS